MNNAIYVSFAVLKLLAKLLFLAFSAAYIGLVFIFLHFGNLPSEEQTTFIQRGLHKFNLFDARFDIEHVEAAKDELRMTLKNLRFINTKNSDFALSARTVKLTLSPKYLLHFAIPIYFDLIEGLSLEVNAGDADDKSQSREFDFIAIENKILRYAKILPIIFKTTIKHGLKIADANIALIFGHKKQKIYIEKFLLYPKKFTFGSNVALEGAGNFEDIKFKLQGVCKFGVNTGLKYCNLNTDITGIYRGFIANFQDFPKEYIPLPDKLSVSVAINLAKKFLMPKVTLAAKDTLLHLDKKIIPVKDLQIGGRFEKHALKIDSFSIISQDIALRSEDGFDICVDFAKNFATKAHLKLALNQINHDQIKIILPDSLSGDVDSFLSFFKKASNIKTDIKYENDALDGTANIEKVEGFIDGFGALLASRGKISILKNGDVEINFDQITGGGVKIDNLAANIDPSETGYLEVKTSAIEGNLGVLFAGVPKNYEYYKYLDYAYNLLIGKKCRKDCLQFRVLDTKTLIPFANDIFHAMSFAARGTMKTDDLQLFTSQNPTLSYEVMKKPDTKAISVLVKGNSYFNLPLSSELSSGAAFRIMNKIDLDEDIIVKSEIDIAKRSFADVYVKSGVKGDLLVNARILRPDLHLSLLDFNDSLKIILHANGLDIGQIFDIDLAIPRLDSPPSNIRSLNLDLALQNLNLKNNAKINKLIAEVKYLDNTVENIMLDLKLTRNSESESISIKQDANRPKIFILKANRISEMLAGFDIGGQIGINDIVGEIDATNKNILDIYATTGKITFKTPSLPKDSVPILKFVIPSYSASQGAFSYNKSSFHGKLFTSEHSKVINVDDFYVKSDIAKISVSGYCNFTEEYLDISGKINSAYRISRILSAEDVPILNKIMTLGSKDGGYGVISYRIKSKFSELSGKSVNIGGDRANLVAAGALVAVNPLLAIPFLLGSKASK